MKVTTRSNGSVVVLDVGRRLTVEEDLGELDRRVVRHLRRGCRKFVLDLERTRSLDAAGVGELVYVFSLVQAAGGRMYLLHLRRQARDLLERVRLSSVFRSFNSESEAVRRLQAPAPRRRSPESGGRTRVPTLGPSPAC